MASNILQEKKAITETVECTVKNTSNVLLFEKAMVGSSYPLKHDVPGIWVNGPDLEGLYVVKMSVVVLGLKNIPDVINALRSEIWNKLVVHGLDGRVRSVNVKVEDLLIAA